MANKTDLHKLADEAAKEVVEELLNGTNTNVISGTQRLAEEAEQTMDQHQEPETAREHLRKQLDELPVQAQNMWLRVYYSAKEYAVGEPDLQAKASEYAARTAWDVVKARVAKKSGWNKQASIDFDAAAGKWTVSHSNLLNPVAFSNKKDAEGLANVLVVKEQPSISMDKGIFAIKHSSWKDPVTASTPEEATEVVVRKMKDEGWTDEEANRVANDMVNNVNKEASVDVKADAKQNVKGGPGGPLVTGIAPDTSGVKQAPGQTKDRMPEPSGYVVTEGPVKKTIEPNDLSKSMKQKHEGGAAAFDALVNQLKSKRGIMNNVKAAETKLPVVPGQVKVEKPMQTIDPAVKGKEQLKSDSESGAAAFDALVNKLRGQKGIITEDPTKKVYK